MKTHKKARPLTTMLLDIRSPYLEFVRNLAPQVALLTLSFFLGAKAYSKPFGAQESLILLVFFIMFCYAVWANVTRLYEGCFPVWREWTRRTAARERGLKMRPLQTLKYRCAVILRMKLEATAVLIGWFTGVFFLLMVVVFAAGAPEFDS